MHHNPALEMKGENLAEINSTVDQTQPGPSPAAVFRNRNFRLLWAGQAISLLGDQFQLIALPWLVLQLTGDALAVGTVMAVIGLPRAIFMLVGGVFSDRFSPRAVMLASNLVRFGLVAALAVLVLTGSIQLWMLYLFALAFGLADAFFLPAESAIVPRLVEEGNLQIANAIIQGTGQFSLFLGPVLAGGLIALLAGNRTDNPESLSGMTGIGLAFAIDAATFLASALTLWLIRPAQRVEVAGADEKAAAVWAAIRDILVYVWRDETLRYFFLVVAAVSTLMNSLLAVGVPSLAGSRLPGGAAAFGIILSAYGAGSLLGIGLAGILPKPQPGRLGTTLLLITAMGGIGLILLGIVQTTLAAALTSLFMGLALGYVVIQFTTWLQIRTPEVLLGRMMSVLMFAAMGLSPLGMAIIGVLIDANLTGVFVGAGSLLLLVVSLAMTNPLVRAMSAEPAG